MSTSQTEAKVPTTINSVRARSAGARKRKPTMKPRIATAAARPRSNAGSLRRDWIMQQKVCAADKSRELAACEVDFEGPAVNTQGCGGNT